jgi:hypothetical protein
MLLFVPKTRQDNGVEKESAKTVYAAVLLTDADELGK